MEQNDWIDAEQRADRARQLYEQGRWSEAAKELRAAITVNPDQAAWHFNLALTLEAMEDYDGAVASFQTAMELDGEDLECLNCLAANLSRLGRYADALELFEKIQGMDPDYEPAYCNRIALYTEMGDHEKAELAFYRARQISDECPVCSYNIAHSLYVRRQLERAVLCWKDVCRMAPDHPHAQARIAETYWRMGRRDLAEQYYESQLGVAPEDADAMLDYGDLLMELEQLDRAERCYRRASKVAPTDPTAYVALGELAMKRGQSGEAEGWFRLALALDQDSAQIHVKLAEALLGRGQKQQAGEHLTIAIRAAGDDPRILADCAHVLMQAHRMPQAHKVLQRLVSLCPENAIARHNLAVTCFRMRKLDEGIRHCRAAIRLRRDYPLAWYNLAVAHMKRGEMDRARSCVGRAMKIDPQNPSLADLAQKLRHKESLWSRVRGLLPWTSRHRRDSRGS